MTEQRLFDAAFLGQLEQLRLRFRGKAAGQSGGGRRSRQQGISPEFSDFREYQLGDDLRRIDWNAYARFDRLVTKLFLEERQMRVNLILDQSASMQLYGKHVMAKRLALTLAYLALSSYDQVSVLPIGEGRYEGDAPSGQALPWAPLGPVTGKAQFLRSAQYLEDLPAARTSPISESIKGIRFPAGPGVSYLFTDAFSQDGMEDALAYLRYQKQDTTLVHILSPEELNPPYEGELRLIDAETGERKELELTPTLTARYRQALDGFCARLKESCHRNGFRYEAIPSNMDIREAVLGHLMD